MAKLPVVKYPAEVLTTIASPVETFDGNLKSFVEDMKETMKWHGGIGLAANQVDDLRRILVMKHNSSVLKDKNSILAMINPEIESTEGELNSFEEGCLSFPGTMGKVERPDFVKVKFWDVEGTQHILELQGLEAICVQHEIDHLNGIVFTDRMSRLNKNMTLKKYKKRNK